MARTDTANVRNVVVVGHKGVGKTSLVEAMRYVARASPRLGRVSDHTAALDDTPEERAHAATLESRVTHLQWGDARVNVIDTPGEMAFSTETRLALAAADAAVLVLSARDGVQSGAERLYTWIHDAHMPCLAVVTKVDDEGARVEEVATEARAKLHVTVDPMEVPVGTGSRYRGVVAVRTNQAWVGRAEGPGAITPGEVPAEFRDAVARARAHLVDDVAGMDDTLADHYLADGDLSPEELDAGVRAEVAAGVLVPLYFASGTTPSGIAALLDAIVDLVPPPSARPAWKGRHPDTGAPATRESKGDAPTAVWVFKTHVDPHAGRVSYARVLSGTLRSDASLLNPAHDVRERVGTPSLGSQRDAKALAEAHAGDIVALPKLKVTRTGETLCDERAPFVFDGPELPPRLFSRVVTAEGRGADDKLSAALQRLGEEDPALQFAHDPATRELVVSGLGALHLDITAERLRRRAGVDFRLGPPRIAYRETITRPVRHIEGKQKKQTGGHGQFAVCVIDVEPLPLGTGFVFEDAVVGGVIPRQFIPSVEKGVVRAMAQGVLAGYPLVDVKVRLIEGKTHPVDSSDAAFQAAGFKALRNAAREAGVALLQPVARLQVTVPEGSIGDVIGDLNARHGKVLDTSGEAGQVTIAAHVPLVDTLDYEPRLKGLTQGNGSFTLAFDHYEIAPPAVQEKVVRERAFRAEEGED